MPGTILLFGRNAAMMTLVDRQLSAAGLKSTGFMDEEALKAEIEKGKVRLLVIGGGVEAEPRARMKALCEARGILVYEHSGGPQSLPGHILKVLD